MDQSVKIRGIYATALTKLLMDSGYIIVEPSADIQERFGLQPNKARTPDVIIQDRRNRQGVDLIGEADRICPLVQLLQEKFLDTALLEFASFAEGFLEESESVEEAQEAKDIDSAHLEFGGFSKEVLDRIRSAVIPTLPRHHRLQIIRPKILEQAEKKVKLHKEKKKQLGEDLFKEEIIAPLRKAGVVRLEHIKLSGKPIRPREGALVEASPKKLVIKRFFSQGRYNGLALPIEKGDFCLTEAREKSWFIRHSYFDREEKLKGEYYNINTPVELYPYGARYLDLELDVIRRPGEKPFLTDREQLAVLVRKGLISAALEKKALEVAAGLMKKMGNVKE